MSTATTRLGLVMPAGSEPFPDRTQYNGNLQKIDDLTSGINCTSLTRPSSPYAGQIIYETDTRRTLIRNSTNTTWVTISGIPVVNLTSDITEPYNGQIVFHLGNGSLWRYQSSDTTWRRYPDEVTLYKSSTESVTSSTTLQSDDRFAFNVETSSAYALESCIFYDGALDGAGAGGLKMGFSGPAGASMFFNNGGSNGVAGGGSVGDFNAVAETLGAAGRTVHTNAGTVMCCRPGGVLVVGATAGTLQYRWAQGVSNATATRILGGSWMRLSKITYP